MIDLQALALTLGHKDFSVRDGAEFSVDDGETWSDLGALTDAQRSTYDTELAALAARQASDTRIAELKKMLIETDFKVLPGYDQDITATLVDRQAWRDEIRTLEDGA